jgi:hypothetical protein
VEFVPRKTAIEIPVSEKGLQQIGVLQESLPQKAAVAEDHDRVVRQSMVPVKQVHHLFGGLVH